MLYIMRHGKTDWNQLYKLQGRTDIPLNDTGRDMARDAAREYADINFDVCYCSPLIRAKETAELLLEGRDVPIICDDRLKEMSFGVCEGTSNCIEHPELPVYTLFKNPASYKGVEGGETFEDLFARIESFIDEMIRPLHKEGKDILIVGHGALNSGIITYIKKRPLDQFWDSGIPNCKLMEIDFEE